ncbi:hypothetical protein R1sor_010403 [Riccia sorocarpa]|uniref:PX domain-containing protein n=1 Tax=Riccia sorocarpa TaxID=122646 RepID=A0ABD3I1N2_9MARC
MLYEELESLRESSPASGDDGRSTRRTCFDESFEAAPSGDDGGSTRAADFHDSTNASYMLERPADGGDAVQVHPGKVTANGTGGKAGESLCENVFSISSDHAGGTSEGDAYVISAQRSQGIIIGQSDCVPDTFLQTSIAMTEADDRFTNVEQSFDKKYYEEEELEGCSSVSEYNSFAGGDSDKDDFSSFGGSPKYFQALSKTNSNCDQFFSNSDNEIAFGANDWNEYINQNEGALDSIVELQVPKESLAKLQTGEPGIGKSHGDVEDGLEHKHNAESNQPAEEASHEEEAGKLHVDTGDPTASGEGSSVSTSLAVEATAQILEPSHQSGVSVAQNNQVEMTFSEVVLARESAYNSGVAVQGLFEMQSTEKLKTLASEYHRDQTPVPLQSRSEARIVDDFSGLSFKPDTAVAVQDDTPIDAGLGWEVASKQSQKSSQHELVQQFSAESHAQENSVPLVSLREFRVNRLHNMDLDSGEAEAAVQVFPLKPGNNQRSIESPPHRPIEEESKRIAVDWAAEDLGPDELSRYVEALEVKETYIDTVLDMEDVLFDGEGGGGARSYQGGKVNSPGFVRPIRDGSLSASTSNAWASASKQIDQSTCILTDIEWVEIVGAVQRQGGASLGERVVGVKQHTVYRIKVKGSGCEWEVQRRYRDFVVLYSQLQSLFPPNKSVSLPSPWEKVKQESRKYFGNTSPDVVEFRSSLIQACLQSLVKAGPPLSTATPLQRFLYPIGEGSQISVSSGGPSAKSSVKDPPGPTLPLQEFGVDSVSGSLTENDGDGRQSSVLGNTIRLILQVHRKKSLRQQLQVQHYSCAGCYKHLEPALGIVPELVQNWGWSGPRLCEYTGQLFCSTCHLNETAVLPAWVLERWDFTPRLVSQLAKAYLDSIYDKPMLCVSAVNPYLYARVPVLAHLTEMRKKISKMLACIRCPARTRIQSMLGSRRYLLENSDFCALRDLVDLSKGAFAVLPGYMRAVLMKLSSHITRECFLCRELGESCGAREMCEDPYDVIYPHQDELIIRCPTCQQPFHKRCYRKCQKCPACRGPREQTVTGSSLRVEESREQTVGEYGSRSTSVETPMNIDALISSQPQVSENRPSARKSLLSIFLGSIDVQSVENENEGELSTVPHSSTIDL